MKKAIAGLTGLFLTVLFSVLAPYSQAAAARSDVLIGVTTARRMVINHDIQQAKQKAVSDALDLAVQNAFATLVSAQIFASNLEFYYDQVKPRTSDYIITYRVLGGVEDRNHFLVAVESKVDLAQLEKTLTEARILNPHRDRPVIVFFIAEKTPSDLLPRYWWGKNPIPYQSVAERLIAENMRRDQFEIVGSGPERPDPSFYNITFNSIYDVTAAKDLGRELKADMIVFGKASASEAINRMGEERAFDARINLEAYDLKTGDKVVTSQVEAVARSFVEHEGSQKALEKASELSATDLNEKISTYWAETLRKEHAFEVRIEGENFLPRFIALKQRFKQMPGIENMQPREVGSNHALMEVFYKGKSDQFANAVMLTTFDSFGLEISEVSEDLVLIKFINKGEPSMFEEDAAPSDEIQEEDRTEPFKAQE